MATEPDASRGTDKSHPARQREEPERAPVQRRAPVSLAGATPCGPLTAAGDRGAGGVVQCMGGEETDGVLMAASEGLKGSPGALPYQKQIQASFGGHDLGGVQAHVGGPAAVASRAMGAEAYATGDHVAFKAAPDLHTAAHEAAHVVQQRAGVQFAGGVGRSGDPYERQADAAADAVVRGRSAEPLLGGAPGSARGVSGASVQGLRTEPLPRSAVQNNAARGPIQMVPGGSEECADEPGAPGSSADCVDEPGTEGALRPERGDDSRSGADEPGMEDLHEDGEKPEPVAAPGSKRSRQARRRRRCRSRGNMKGPSLLDLVRKRRQRQRMEKARAAARTSDRDAGKAAPRTGTRPPADDSSDRGGQSPRDAKKTGGKTPLLTPRPPQRRTTIAAWITHSKKWGPFVLLGARVTGELTMEARSEPTKKGDSTIRVRGDSKGGISADVMTVAETDILKAQLRLDGKAPRLMLGAHGFPAELLIEPTSAALRAPTCWMHVKGQPPGTKCRMLFTFKLEVDKDNTALIQLLKAGVTTASLALIGRAIAAVLAGGKLAALVASGTFIIMLPMPAGAFEPPNPHGRIREA